MKVMLFGSRAISTIPDVVVNQLEEIIRQTEGNVEFIVGDCIGVDVAFHAVLSRIGAGNKTLIYCTDYPRNNKFDLKTLIFSGEGLEGRELFEVKDKQMCDDCDFAIAVWDGKSRGSKTNIKNLSKSNKYVYDYKLHI